MRLSWYADTGVAVFSIWQGDMCTGTFRLPISELPHMIDTLQRRPDLAGPADRAATSYLHELPAAGHQPDGDQADQADGYSHADRSPDAYSHGGYPRDGYSPDTYSPAGYSPDSYSQDSYSAVGQSQGTHRTDSARRPRAVPMGSLPQDTGYRDTDCYGRVGDVPGSREDLTSPRAALPDYREDLTSPRAALPDYREDLTSPRAALPDYRDDLTSPRAALPDYRDDPTSPRAALPDYRDDPTSPRAALPDYREDLTSPRAALPDYRDDPNTDAYVDAPTPAYVRARSADTRVRGAGAVNFRAAGAGPAYGVPADAATADSWAEILPGSSADDESHLRIPATESFSDGPQPANQAPDQRHARSHSPIV
jgi:hypothetical protein